MHRVKPVLAGDFLSVIFSVFFGKLREIFVPDH